MLKKVTHPQYLATGKPSASLVKVKIVMLLQWKTINTPFAVHLRKIYNHLRQQLKL